MDERVQRLLNRYSNAKASKSNFEDLYQETAKWVLTRKDNISGSISQGEQKNNHIFDTTGVISAQRLGSGLFSYLCPPNEEWFRLRSSIFELNQRTEVQNYFAQVSRAIRQGLYTSNFVLELYEALLDLSVFGTCNLRVEEGTSAPFNFKNIFIGEYAICENSRGEVDTIFREFQLTARQMVEKFGIENVSDEIKKCFEDRGSGKGRDEDKYHPVLHVIQPRGDYNPERIDYTNMPYISLYIDLKNKTILKEGGFKELPYMVARFTKASNEIYGRGSGVNALPNVKLANVMMKTIIMAGEKMVDPPMIMPDDGSLDPFNTSAGAINYWRATSFNNKPEPLKLEPNIPVNLELLTKVQEDIKELFYNDVIQALQDKRNMTATEVVQRVGEKLILMIPSIGRIQSELLSPMINRCFRIIIDQRIVPEPPPILMDYPQYEVMYTSKLAMAVKLLDVDATNDTLTTVAPIIQMQPEAMDVLNTDNIVRGTAYRNGMPPEFLNDPEVVQQKREQRAKQMEQQQMMEQLPAMADGVNKLDGTDIGKQLTQQAGAGEQ